MQIAISRHFKDFFESEKSSGLILLFCTILSLALTNLIPGSFYLHIWHFTILLKPIEFWINEGLMTIFFLLIGLEIERELYIGELADLKRSMLPVLAAIGGMLVPAGIHFSFNHGMDSQHGFGIPMATDIAFSIAILSLLGRRVPASLKIFLTALAIIDDLGAIVVIALFYSRNFSFLYFGLAVLTYIIMLLLKRARFYRLWMSLVLGCVLWSFIEGAGIHPTISGVLLAFAIPFGKGDEKSPSYRLQHWLHKPVAFFILPLFALANTAILISPSVISGLTTSNSYGIIFGLLIGKPLGIFLFSTIGAAIGWCSIPATIKKSHLLWLGFLAGIGFTMSIFITLLAFSENSIIDESKIAIMVGSLIAGMIGYIGLKLTLKPQPSEIAKSEP